MELLRLLGSLNRMIQETVRETERRINEARDESTRELYRDYLRDIREMAGILGKVVNKMAMDGILDPREAELIMSVGIERR